MMKRFFSSALLFLLAAINLPSQEPYQKPALEHKGSWSLIMVPDLQNYGKCGRNQPLVDLMMASIVENVDLLNIKMVMGVGDLVENNEKNHQ